MLSVLFRSSKTARSKFLRESKDAGGEGEADGNGTKAWLGSLSLLSLSSFAFSIYTHNEIV